MAPELVQQLDGAVEEALSAELWCADALDWGRWQPSNMMSLRCQHVEHTHKEAVNKLSRPYVSAHHRSHFVCQYNRRRRPRG